MPNPFHRLLERIRPKSISWTHCCVLLSCILLGTLLAALYLPLPASRIMVATEVYDIHHNLAATFFNQNRRPVKLAEIPDFLQKAFLAVEDHRFYSHKGINPGRIIKATWHNLRYGQISQGASTITQQLAKNVYLNQERNYTRKIKELFYTIKLEMQYSKTKIFEMYLNQIYFGHGAYGVQVAAETYFQTPLKALNEAELALLAGLPRGPAFYCPYTHPQAAKRRIRQTLKRMVECGYITSTQFDAYAAQPLSLPGLKSKNDIAPYFVDLLQKEMARLFPGDPELLYNAGLKIESTLDLRLQGAADQAFQGLPKLYRDQRGLIQPQGGLIAADPTTGEIRALIGGTDFEKSQFNRAISARRQPGSSFKPILYATALSRGYTLSSVFELSPKTYMVGSKPYKPTDHGDETTSGLITLREALASSSNVVAVKLLEELGFDPVIALAAQMGIKSKLAPLLPLALGSSEITPMELTTAYIPLANGGTKYKPVTIRRVLDHQGRVLYQHKPEGTRVLDPEVSFLVTQALTGVLKAGGTAVNIGHLVGRPAAGKTGTTEKNRDAWFVGYTPELLACVFVGCDHNERALPGAANRIAAPIWAKFISTALQNQPPRDFEIPEHVKLLSICKQTKDLATASCPGYPEYFLEGTEPKSYCEDHRFIQLKVCRRSGLLLGPNCTHFREKEYALKDAPTALCNQCEPPSGFFRFLRRLFKSHRRHTPQEDDF